MQVFLVQEQGGRSKVSFFEPLPIVDLQESARLARDKIWGHKKHPAVQQEKKRLLQTHVNAR